MEFAPRPHRAWHVLAWGIGGLWAVFLIHVPLGLVAFIAGAIELYGMRRGRIDSSGRSIARIGLVLGIGGTLLYIPMLAAGFVFVMTEGMEVRADPASPGVELVKVYYPPGPTGLYPAPVRLEFRTIHGPDGQMVREGHFVERTCYGWKISEGNYEGGLREGPWTFWNEDGSIDRARSGVYESDVRLGD